MTADQELNIWKTINATRTITGLIETLKEIGPIEISGGRGAYDMAQRVNDVLAGAPLNALTRNYGIRQQYLYLRRGGRH